MRFTGFVIGLMCALAPGCRDSIPVTACGEGCLFTCVEGACLRFPDGSVGDVALDAQPRPDLLIDVARSPEVGMPDASTDTAPSDGRAPDSEPMPEMGAPDGPAPLPTLMLQPVGRDCAERGAMEVEVTSLGAYLEGAAPEGSEDVEIYLPTAPPDCSCPYALPVDEDIADGRSLIPRWRIVGCLGSVCHEGEECTGDAECLEGRCVVSCPAFLAGEGRCRDDRNRADTRLTAACACGALGAACVRHKVDQKEVHACRSNCSDSSDCPPDMVCAAPEKKTWLVMGPEGAQQQLDPAEATKFCMPLALQDDVYRATCLTSFGTEDIGDVFEELEAIRDCVLACIRAALSMGEDDQMQCAECQDLGEDAHLLPSGCSPTHHVDRCNSMPASCD